MRIMHSGKSGLLFLLILIPSLIADGQTRRHPAPPYEQGNRRPADDGDAPYEDADKSISVDTQAGDGVLSPNARKVIAEINLMRRDPASYCRNYLVPLRAYYDGDLYKYPGAIPVRTKEGAAALDECIRELEHARPLPGFSSSKGLSLAARDHVRDQGPSGMFGHTGSDGSSIVNRVSRYGQWELTVGENISYGYGDARKIVAALLIDDGIPSRGHRKNLLNGSYHLVGVNVGPHRLYGDMCVMDFAGGYRSR